MTQPAANLTAATFRSNPFVGLRPYESADTYVFFGRNEHTFELMTKLKENRFIGVVGSSGCGKSSLIRAGLLPKLKAGFLIGERSRWRDAVMRPGVEPLRHLAIALLSAFSPAVSKAEVQQLADEIDKGGLQSVIKRLGELIPGDTNLLLLVDQFEEVFEIEKEKEPKLRAEAADFVALMLGLAEQTVLPMIYVVMTMRSDFLGDCDRYHGLPEALNRSQYLVPRLRREQRREAIEGPITLYGQEITQRLLDCVLNEMGDQSDQLPVLQHALMRTWDVWEGDPQRGPLDWRHYEQTGTLTDALSIDADAALEKLSMLELRTTKLMFQALTKLDENKRRTRSRQTLDDLVAITGADRDQLIKIINRFRTEGRAFLRLEEPELASNPLVDISHESLIRQWKKLKDEWLIEEDEWSAIYIDLAKDAEDYYKSNDPSFFWDGVKLERAQEWLAERLPNAAWAERYHPRFDDAMRFLKASEQESVAKKERELEQLERDRKLNSKLRILNLGLLLALLGSMLVGGYAYVKRDEAAISAENLKTANDKILANYKQLDDNAKQMESYNKQLQSSNKQLKDTNEQIESTKRKLEEQNQKLDRAADELARKNLALNEATNDLMRKNRELFKAQQELAKQNNILEENAKELNRAVEEANAASRKAEEKTAEAESNLKKLMEMRKREAKELSRKLASLGSAKFDSSPNLSAILIAQSLVAMPQDDEDRLSQKADYTMTREANDVLNKLLSLVPPLARADRTIFGVYGKGEIAFSQDGDYLATVSNARTVQLWSMNDGRTEFVAQTRTHNIGVRRIALSPQANCLVTENVEGELRIWRNSKKGFIFVTQEEDDPLGKSIDPGAPITAFALSQDGNRLATAITKEGQVEHLVQLWDTQTAQPIGKPFKHLEAVQAIAFSPDGKYLGAGTGKKEGLAAELAIYIWDVIAPNASQPIEKIILSERDKSWRGRVNFLAFSPGGKYLATSRIVEKERADQADPSAVQVWTFSPQKQKPLEVSGVSAGSAALLRFSPDETRLALVKEGFDRSHEVNIHDLASKWKELKARMQHDGIVRAIAFNAGNTLRAVSEQGVVREWKDLGSLKNTRTVLPPATANLANSARSDIGFSSDQRMIAVSSRERCEMSVVNGDYKCEPLGREAGLIALSPNGEYLAMTAEGGIEVKRSDRSQPGSIVNFKSQIKSLFFSPNGKYLAITDTKGGIAVAEPASPNNPVLLATEGEVMWASFSGDSQKLVTVCRAEARPPREALPNTTDQAETIWAAQVWLWRPGTWVKYGQPVEKSTTYKLDARVPKTVISAAALDYSAKYLALAYNREDDSESALTIFDVARTATKGREDERVMLKRPIEAVGLIRTLVFSPDVSPDRKYLVAKDRFTEIWELEPDSKETSKLMVKYNKAIAQFPERGDKYVFSADGKYLAALSSREAWFWLWDPQQLVVAACQRLGSNISEEQWYEYVGERNYRSVCENIPQHESFTRSGIAMIERAIQKAGSAAEVMNNADAKRILAEAEETFARIERSPMQRLGGDAKTIAKAEAEWRMKANEADKKLEGWTHPSSGILNSKFPGYDQNTQDANLKGAIESYQAAERIYRERPAWVKLDGDGLFPRRFASPLNQLCWWGSLYGKHKEQAVISACEQAVLADLTHAGRRDSRGVNYALNGKYDKAKDDFQGYLNWTTNKEQYDRRKKWIEILGDKKEEKRNPFDSTELEWVRCLDGPEPSKCKRPN
jgi:WD40 repeat protein/methyl-accepting chemotaxis protein/energy-coupling factor transporter ATP-binding protein EcfA2